MRTTKQKQVVYDAVLSSCDHPTAETLLSRCKNVLPSVNLATVYRNLNSLVLENKIRRISLTSGDRFDKTLYNHAHFKCNCCGSVFDVLEVDVENAIKSTCKEVAVIDEVDFTLTGKCSACANSTKN